MKHILFIVILLFSFTANAEVYLLVDNNDEIVSMSPEDDAQLSNGLHKTILVGDLSDYQLSDKPTNYKYKNNKFIKNIDKISNKEIKKEKGKKKADELTLINNKSMLDAMIALEAEGVVFNEVKHSDFE